MQVQRGEYSDSTDNLTSKKVSLGSRGILQSEALDSNINQLTPAFIIDSESSNIEFELDDDEDVFFSTTCREGLIETLTSRSDLESEPRISGDSS